MKRVEQDISCLRDDGARNLQQRRGGLLQPIGAEVAGKFWTVWPVCRQPGEVDLKNGQIIRSRNFEQSVAGRDVVGAGVDADFEKCCGWAGGEVHDRVADMMPSAWQPLAARSAEVEMATDPPQDHLDEIAFVNLSEELFDESASGISGEQAKRRAAVEPRILSAQPVQGAFARLVDGLSQREHT